MSPKSNTIWVVIVAALLILRQGGGMADTVYKTDGTAKEGRVVAESEDEIVLEMTIGGMKASIHIPKSEIARIVRSKPEEAAPRQQEPAPERGDAQAQAAMKKGHELLEAGEYAKATETLEPLLSLPLADLNSIERKDVLSDLIRCYECTGAWDKAEAKYEDLLKCPTIDKGVVALIRVKQRLLKENPDGMIDLGAYAPEARTHPERRKRDKADRQPLSDPKGMGQALRGEAQKILDEAEQKAARADAQVLSDKIWGTEPIKVSVEFGRSLTDPKRVTLEKSAGYSLYEEAAEDAADADDLAPGISGPLRLKIAQKQAALIEQEIAKTRKKLEGHSYYMPPPPADLPAAQEAAFRRDQNLRLQALNVSLAPAKEFLEMGIRLEALEDARLEVLEPFSDQLPTQVDKLRKEREQIADLRQKANQIAELYEAVKECERLEALFEEYAAKARANQPSNFDYGYERFLNAQGIYPFKKESARRWGFQTDLCFSLCQEARKAGVKWINLMKKFPDRPQFARQIEIVKGKITQIYALGVKVWAERDKKGRAPTQ